MPRQHHVEQHQVERLARRALEPALAVGALSTRVALAGESIAKGQHQAGLVLDEQQPLHACDRVALRLRYGGAADRFFTRGRQADRELAALARARSSRRSARHGPATMRCTRLRPSPAPWICAAIDIGGAIERFEDSSPARPARCRCRDRDGHAAPRRPPDRRECRSISPLAPYLMALRDQILEHAAQCRLVAERPAGADRPSRTRCGRRPARRRRRRASMTSCSMGAAQPGARTNARCPDSMPGELENLLDHLGQAASLITHQLAVLANLLLVFDHAVGEIFGGGSDDRQRRPQLVRHGGDELHLLTRELLRASRRHHQHRHAGAEHCQDARADDQVSPPRDVDRCFERAGRVLAPAAPMGAAAPCGQARRRGGGRGRKRVQRPVLLHIYRHGIAVARSEAPPGPEAARCAR